jgi:hypothetical protein
MNREVEKLRAIRNSLAYPVANELPINREARARMAEVEREEANINSQRLRYLPKSTLLNKYIDHSAPLEYKGGSLLDMKDLQMRITLRKEGIVVPPGTVDVPSYVNQFLQRHNIRSLADWIALDPNVRRQLTSAANDRAAVNEEVAAADTRASVAGRVARSAVNDAISSALQRQFSRTERQTVRNDLPFYVAARQLEMTTPVSRFSGTGAGAASAATESDFSTLLEVMDRDIEKAQETAEKAQRRGSRNRRQTDFFNPSQNR